MTDTTTKVRAAFLAAVVVVSVFAGTIAFAGTAAAATVGGATATKVSADEKLTQQRVSVTVNSPGTAGTVNLDYSNVPSDARIADVSVQSGSVQIDGSSVSHTDDSASFNVTGGSAGDVIVTLAWQTTDVDTGQMDLNVNVNGGPGTDVTVDIDDLDAVDAFAGGGQTFWKGQNVYFQASSSGTYQIRQVRTNQDSPDEVGTLVQEFSIDQDGGAQLINTGSNAYEAGQEYVITNANRQPLGTSSLGITTGTTSLNSASWEVQVQDLTAEWDEDEITNDPASDNDVDLDFDSNRGTYDVTVSADGLDSGDLEDIFRSENVIATDDTDDEVIIGGVSGDDTLTGNFTDIDADDYNFNFEVVDAAASAQSNITVTAAEGSLSLPGSITQARGDVVTVNANLSSTDTGYIQVGSSEAGYNATIEVKDGGDGQVGIQMNTYYAGLNESGGNWSNATAGQTPGSARDGIESDLVYSLTGDSDDDDSIENVWLHSNSLDQPLDAGTYDVAVGREAVSAPNGQYVEDEDDVTSLELEERGTQGVQIWRAPGDADYGDLPELLTQVNQTRRVAGGQDQNVGDLVVVQLQASGISGYLLGGAAPTDDIFEPDVQRAYDDSQGFMLTIEDDPGANQESAKMALTSNAVQDFFVDNANDSAYLVVGPTASTNSIEGNFAFESDEDYNATFEINSDNAMIEEDEDTAGQEKEEAGRVFSLQEPDARFDRLNGSDVLQVPSTQNARVSGTTNLAPGTELTVRLRNTEGGAAFLKSNDVTVQGNGSFSTTVDMSDVDPQTEFTAIVRRGGTDVSDEFDGLVVEQQETTTAEETTTTAEETTTGTPTEETTTAEETTATATQTTTAEGGSGSGGGGGGTSTEGNTPGFGIVVALVALLAAALLATRREN